MIQLLLEYPGTAGLLATLSIKASLVLALVLAICYLAKRTSASLRYFIMSAALVSVALMPCSALLLPQWDVVPVPQRSQEPLTELPPLTTTGDLFSPGPQMQEHPETGSTRLAMQPVNSPWSYLLALVYLLGAGLSAARTVTILAWTRWLRRGGSPLGPEHAHIRRAATSAAIQTGIDPSIRILFSSRLSIPLVCGGRKPSILLPQKSVDWSGEFLKSVFLHEMAHVKRKDELAAIVFFENII